MTRVKKDRTREGWSTKWRDLGLVLRLYDYLKPHRSLLILALALIPLASFAALIQPYLVKYTVDAVLVDHDEALWQKMVGLFGVAVLVEFVVRFAQMYVMQLAGQRSMADLRGTVFQHALGLRLSYFDRTPTGRVLTRITNDVDALGELFSSGAVMAVADIFMLLGIVFFMLLLDWRLSLVAFAVLPFLGLFVELVRRFARRAFRDIRARVAQLNSYLSEQVQGIQVVQAFGQEKRSGKEYRTINDAYRNANHRAIKLDALLYSVVESLSICCVALVLYYASFRAEGFSQHARVLAYIGTVVAFYQYIQQFFVPIRDLSTKYTIIQSALASAERVFEFLDRDELESVSLDQTKPEGESPRLNGSQPMVAFRQVSFGYRDDEQVLKEVDFSIETGEHVAIVGATGAGKTSTISLLMRLYETSEGRIEVGGADIRKIPLAALRGLFAVVPQDIFLFTGTIAENVAPGVREPDYERIEHVLSRVGALDIVQARPRGIHSPVDERGVNFSVGERQLIAFARALYEDAPILILDEATASIDSETEARLQAAADELLRGRTAITIAHRLSTIEKSDRILVFHKGRIAETGRHENLLAGGGIYAHLYQMMHSTTS